MKPYERIFKLEESVGSAFEKVISWFIDNSSVPPDETLSAVEFDVSKGTQNPIKTALMDLRILRSSGAAKDFNALKTWYLTPSTGGQEWEKFKTKIKQKWLGKYDQDISDAKLEIMLTNFINKMDELYGDK